MLNIQFHRKAVAATVTSATPIKFNENDPAALAVGGTSATGYNASSEGTSSDTVLDTVWNVLNGEWLYLPVPEARIRVQQGGIWTVKLNTAPAASMNIICAVEFMEFR